MSTNKTLL